MASVVDIAVGMLKIGPQVIGLLRPARGVRELGGIWHSRYQRGDQHVGEWITEKTEIKAHWRRRLVFRNRNNQFGGEYEAFAKLYSQRHLVGRWKATRGASAGGVLHLYVDPFGDMMYGLCSCPTETGAQMYTGWVLAREAEDLDKAQRILTERMLVCVRSSVVKDLTLPATAARKNVTGKKSNNEPLGIRRL